MTSENSAVQIALALSMVLHLLMYYFWQAPSVHRQSLEAGQPLLTVRLMTSLEPDRVKPEDLPAKLKDAKKTASAMPSLASGPRATPVTLPHSASAAPVEEGPDMTISSPVPRSADDMILDAKRNIGRIDRDVNKLLTLPAQNSGQSRLEQGIAAAARTDRTSMLERILSGGRKITKVSSPLGTYCVVQDSVGTSDGIDRMQRGTHAKVTNCGHLFD